jgi:hypothetical protein
VTQRPAEIDPTILSQCNTVFALRMANDRDQDIVRSAIADTGSGLLEFLSALGSREAIAFGDGVTLPVRIKFDELPPHALPRSSTARFSEKWQKPVGDMNFLEAIVERWRAAGTATLTEEESAQQAADLFPGQGGILDDEPVAAPTTRLSAAAASATARPSLRQPAAASAPAAAAMAPRRAASLLRRDPAEAAAPPVAAAAAAPAPAERPRTARDLLQGWSARRG